MLNKICQANTYSWVANKLQTSQRAELCGSFGYAQELLILKGRANLFYNGNSTFESFISDDLEDVLFFWI